MYRVAYCAINRNPVQSRMRGPGSHSLPAGAAQFLLLPPPEMSPGYDQQSGLFQTGLRGDLHANESRTISKYPTSSQCMECSAISAVPSSVRPSVYS
jgi:hypothetical protein